MTYATYIEKDQNWTKSSTTYWFDVEGEIYGVVEGENAGLVDSESMPINSEPQHIQDRIAQACVVTDTMRAEEYHTKPASAGIIRRIIMITNIRAAARIVGKSEATLHRWRKTNPDLFQAVIEYAAKYPEKTTPSE